MDYQEVLKIIILGFLVIVLFIVIIKGRQSISNFRYVRKWGMEAYRYELLLDYMLAAVNPEEYEARKEQPKALTRSSEGNKIKTEYYRQQVSEYLIQLRPFASAESLEAIQRFFDDTSAEKYNLAIEALQNINTHKFNA